MSGALCCAALCMLCTLWSPLLLLLRCCAAAPPPPCRGGGTQLPTFVPDAAPPDPLAAATGYKFELIQREGAIPEPLAQVRLLRCPVARCGAAGVCAPACAAQYLDAHACCFPACATCTGHAAGGRPGQEHPVLYRWVRAGAASCGGPSSDAAPCEDRTGGALAGSGVGQGCAADTPAAAAAARAPAEVLGMRLLRTRENPEYKYTLAFLGGWAGRVCADAFLL